ATATRTRSRTCANTRREPRALRFPLEQRVADRELAVLLDRDRDRSLSRFFQAIAAHDQRVARHHHLGEARLERAEARRIAARECLERDAPGDAVGAESVQDRALETGLLRDLWVRVDRVYVARESIQQRLVRARLHLDLELRRLILRRLGAQPRRR